MANEDSMHIRPATPGDAENISALLKALSAYYLSSPDDANAVRYFADTSPARIRANIAAPDLEYIVAEIGGEFAGFVSTQGGHHILQFFVERKFQDKRVGKRLWKHALDAIRARRTMRDITVNASVFAVPVYGRFGFEIAGERTTENGVTFVPMILRAEEE
jgi:GNAT superfamily N-acetyltransferase